MHGNGLEHTTRTASANGTSDRNGAPADTVRLARCIAAYFELLLGRPNKGGRPITPARDDEAPSGIMATIAAMEAGLEGPWFSGGISVSMAVST